MPQSSTSANKASYDELLQQLKKTIFEFYFFDVLKRDAITCYRMKKLIGQININACPTYVGEALIDIKNLIDQISVEHNRERDDLSKLHAKEKAQTTKFDNSHKTSQEVEKLETSFKAAQADYNVYAKSISL